MFPSHPLGKAATKAICLVAILVGIVWNIRFGIADLASRKNLPSSTRLAMRLMPSAGAYPAQLADEQFAMDPAGSRLLLQKAVKLNHYDASSWIQLGLLSEAENDLGGAESDLLEAARVDATFLPSWSLANFYFRRENPASFWYWAQRAAQMAPDDATPLFRLAWYVNPSVPEVEKRLELKRPQIEAQFVTFLIRHGDALAVQQAASHLLTAHPRESAESVLTACEWLIENRRPDLALPVWNGLTGSHGIPYAPLDARAMDAITNGNFGQSPLSRGFDWHLPTIEGVSSSLDSQPNVLGFEFSGNEPDAFLLMNQAVPVKAQRDYYLASTYTTTGIPSASGMTWVVTDARSGAFLAATGSLSAEQGGKAIVCFSAPAGTTFVDVSLRYQRQPGTVRAEGKLSLQEVRLTAAAGGHCGNGKIQNSGDASPRSETTLKKQ